MPSPSSTPPRQPAIRPVILAGGSGERLWPLSRPDLPKPLLSLDGKQTLLQATARRVSDTQTYLPPLILTQDRHGGAVLTQLTDAGCPPARIVLEPQGRGTAPACAVAALLCQEDVLLILPVDHHINDPDAFHAAVSIAADAARRGNIVVFGITPQTPHGGYGYILPETASSREDARPIRTFIEKPDPETAEKLINDGALWNSGMFLFQPRELLRSMEETCPDIIAACRKAVSDGQREGETFSLDPRAFRSCPAAAFDTAVMERTGVGAVVPADIGWHDIGSWQSVCEIAGSLGDKTDGDGNIAQGNGMFVKARRCYIHSQSKPVAVLGVDDLVVVETPDAVLVCSRHFAEDVRLIAQMNREETS